MAITKLESSKDYLRIWFLWKRQAIIVFWVIVLLVMAYAYTAKAVYESNAELLVMAKTREGEVISAGEDERRVVPITENDIYTEIEILTSHSVLANTVKSLNADQSSLSDSKKSIVSLVLTPIKMTGSAILRALRLTSDQSSELEKRVSKLKDSLIISPVIDSNIITIALHGEVPRNTFTILQTLLDKYFEHRSRVFSQREGMHFFNDQATDFRTRLQEAERKLKSFEFSQNIVNFGEQIFTEIELLAKLTEELKMLEVSYAQNCARISMLQLKMSADTTRVYLTRDMRRIPAILELEKGLVPVLIERSGISGGFTKGSREFKIIDQQIDMLRSEIRFEVEKAIRTEELEIESMRIKILSLKEKIAQLRSNVCELNQKGRTHQDLTRKVVLYRKNFSLYENKAEESKVFNRKSERRLANVSVSSEPTLLQKPIAPKRGSLLMLALVSGLAAALALPFLLEVIDNKLKSADDVEALVKLPVICSFNDIK